MGGASQFDESVGEVARSVGRGGGESEKVSENKLRMS